MGKDIQSYLDMCSVDFKTLYNKFETIANTYGIFKTFNRASFVDSCNEMTCSEIEYYIVWIYKQIQDVTFSKSEDYLRTNFSNICNLKSFLSKAFNYIRLKETGAIPPKEDELELLERLFDISHK